MKIIDNVQEKLRDELRAHIQSGDKVSVIAACFSIYAYQELKKELDAATEVEVYAKLPGGPKGYCIPTPVGDYSPDWAIVLRKEGQTEVKFVAETKGSTKATDLRDIERAKIYCASKMFEGLCKDEIVYDFVDNYEALRDSLVSGKRNVDQLKSFEKELLD